MTQRSGFILYGSCWLQAETSSGLISIYTPQRGLRSPTTDTHGSDPISCLLIVHPASRVQFVHFSWGLFMWKASCDHTCLPRFHSMQVLLLLLATQWLVRAPIKLLGGGGEALWGPCNFTPIHSLTGLVGQPFASRLSSMPHACPKIETSFNAQHHKGLFPFAKVLFRCTTVHIHISYMTTQKQDPCGLCLQ